MLHNPQLKYSQLRLVDDDTNEDEDEDNSIASCPPATQSPSATTAPNKSSSLLISKLKANSKSSKQSGDASPPLDNSNQAKQRRYLHLNTLNATPATKLSASAIQDLPPAFRQRKTIGYNLLSGNNSADRYRAGQIRGVGGQVPRKALRFSQQFTTSSGSSTNSPIFNSFAERRRAQFTNFKGQVMQPVAASGGGRNSRRNSGASIHSMMYEQDNAAAAAAVAAVESTADSLERLDSQLHGLNDEVWKLGSDVKLTLYLLKQMCDLATSSLTSNINKEQLDKATTDDNEANGKGDFTTKQQCNNCNSKLIEQLKSISSNIELSAQLNANKTASAGQAAKQQQSGILKYKKKSITSNSSQSLTDMINEQNRLLISNKQQQKIKLTSKLAKCSSHSTLSLPVQNSPPGKDASSKLNFSAVRFSGLSTTINEIKELNEFKSSSDLKPEMASCKLNQTIKQSSLEEDKSELNLEKDEQQTDVLRNVRHSWNSLTQFADSSSSTEQQSIEADKSKQLDKEEETIQQQQFVDLNVHSSDLPPTSDQSSTTLANQTIFSQSNGNPANYLNSSCAIDIESSSDNDKPSNDNI